MTRIVPLFQSYNPEWTHQCTSPYFFQRILLQSVHILEASKLMTFHFSLSSVFFHIYKYFVYLILCQGFYSVNRFQFHYNTSSVQWIVIGLENCSETCYAVSISQKGIP